AEEWIEVGRMHFGINFPIEGRQFYKERVAIAWALHRKTNQSQKWVAEKLDLRSAANVSQQVRRFQQQLSTGKPEFVNRTSKEILEWAELVKNC
ncbi:MAG: hypothetical protein ACTHJQ_17045, partial [Rhizobiaceae bacterium]